jgi:hypothetical protein
MKYTFKFGAEEEGKFRRIVERLEPEEYTVLEEISIIDLDNPRTSERQAVMDMDPEAALTFRLGMKNVIIRRERTEEELAEEKRINDQHKVTITVKVDGMNADGTMSNLFPIEKGSLLDPKVLAEKLEGIQLR